jgi:hypothetical protein
VAEKVVFPFSGLRTEVVAKFMSLLTLQCADSAAVKLLFIIAGVFNVLDGFCGMQTCVAMSQIKVTMWL